MKAFKKKHSTLIGILTVLLIVAVFVKVCWCVQKKLCSIDETEEK